MKHLVDTLNEQIVNESKMKMIELTASEMSLLAELLYTGRSYSGIAGQRIYDSVIEQLVKQGAKDINGKIKWK